MSTGRTLYWLFVGVLLGIGLIAILGIGIFLLIPGIALLIFGAARFRGRGLWAVLVGFGAAPALLLLWDVSSGPWACQPANHTYVSPTLPPGASYTSPSFYSCVSTPLGQLTTYHVMAAGFGAIALFGLLLGLAALLWRRSHTNERPGGALLA